MLQKLHIQNYAIIDELQVSFSSRLNIITGETGAGKSILMGALSLILGERADSSVLQQKDRKCVVEGLFTADGHDNVKDFLRDNDLDVEEELLIRREIAANGKSRAFINDTPVNLGQLRSLSALLVDLHQQFDTLELGETAFQQEVLDALAANAETLREYRTTYHQYLQQKKELEELNTRQQAANAQLDYNSFLFEELDAAAFKDSELEDLDVELKLLSNAESVKQQLGVVYTELKESEQPIVQQLKVLANKLHALEEFHTEIPVLVKRLLGAQVELQDIADELDQINDSIHYSAERIQIVNDRISLGYKLLKKHGVNHTSELLAIKEELEQKLSAILNISEAIKQKELLTQQLLKQCTGLSKTISAKRSEAIKPFTKKVNELLAQVGMPNAQFAVDLQDTGTLQSSGSDKIEFLFDANKSKRFEPLRKVASGGELSRLMLCIKSLVASKLDLPTLIFDEIDTGISGEAARQVGNIMKGLSGSHQLISITHQPQIAARADAHYFVYKAISNDKIITAVRVLDNDERITAIAQMLSGEKPTAAALQNAREMVGN